MTLLNHKSKLIPKLPKISKFGFAMMFLETSQKERRNIGHSLFLKYFQVKNYAFSG